MKAFAEGKFSDFIYAVTFLNKDYLVHSLIILEDNDFPL